MLYTLCSVKKCLIDALSVLSEVCVDGEFVSEGKCEVPCETLDSEELFTGVLMAQKYSGVAQGSPVGLERDVSTSGSVYDTFGRDAMMDVQLLLHVEYCLSLIHISEPTRPY